MIEALLLIACLLLIIFGFIQFFGKCVSFRYSESTTDPRNLGDQLLEQDFQQASLKGSLNRKDVQKMLDSTEKWKCKICQFINFDQAKQCVLCKTGKSDAVAILSTEQECAKKRKYWVRVLDQDGKLSWENNLEARPSINPSKNPIASSIGYLSAPLGDIVTYEKNDDDSDRLTFIGSGYSSSIEYGFDNSKVQEISNYEFYDKYNWFLDKLSSTMIPYEKGHVKLKLLRDTILNHSLDLLSHLKGEELRKIWRITLNGEDGLDAGGVLREWYTLVSQQLLSPEVGLFVLTSNNCYDINPNSAHDCGEDHLVHYESFGKFLGRSLLDGQVLPFTFCVPFFKHLLGIPLSFSDLKYLDEELYNSMKFIKESNNISDLCITFSISQQVGSTVKTIDLKPNGDNIFVNDENKEEYIHLRWKYLVLDRVASQLRSILSGFYQVLSKDLVMVFDYKELELLICGFSTINVEDWADNAVATSNLFDSKVLSWFWEVISSLSEHEKAKFLQFTTGSPRVPVQGFKGLTSYDGKICLFYLNGLEYSKENMYIKAHSCFNRVDLPLYKTKEELECAVQIIINMEHINFTLE